MDSCGLLTFRFLCGRACCLATYGLILWCVALWQGCGGGGGVSTNQASLPQHLPEHVQHVPAHPLPTFDCQHTPISGSPSLHLTIPSPSHFLLLTSLMHALVWIGCSRPCIAAKFFFLNSAEHHRIHSDVIGLLAELLMPPPALQHPIWLAPCPDKKGGLSIANHTSCSSGFWSTKRVGLRGYPREDRD